MEACAFYNVTDVDPHSEFDLLACWQPRIPLGEGLEKTVSFYRAASVQ